MQGSGNIDEKSHAKQLPQKCAAIRHNSLPPDFRPLLPDPKIERHRAKSAPGNQRRPPSEEPTASTSSAVRALTRKLEDERRDHRKHTAELRKALEAAHGENLELRRRLARYEPD